MTATQQVFSDLRRTRFQGIAPERRRDLEYLEQLSSQTGTNIDQWEVLTMLDGVAAGDRRAINKLFFAKSGDAKPVEMSAEQKEMLEKLATEPVDVSQQRIAEIDEYNRSYTRDAISRYSAFEVMIKKIWELQREKLMLENRPPSYLADAVKQLISEGFWEFESYSLKKLALVTKQDVVMSEVNTAQGVNRRVNLGRFRAVISVDHMRLDLEPFENNILNRSGYYHPYVNRDGDVCWGNAADTAIRKLSFGDIHGVLTILQALLMTYSQDSTPWQALRDMERDALTHRIDGRIKYCDDCENWKCGCDDSPRCSTCDQSEDDCDCHFCEACNVRYADGDSCGGNYCDECGECYGSDPCSDHYCGHCGEYTLEEDGACRNACCTECGSRDTHRRNCSLRPRTEEEIG